MYFLLQPFRIAHVIMCYALFKMNKVIVIVQSLYVLCFALVVVL